MNYLGGPKFEQLKMRQGMTGSKTTEPMNDKKAAKAKPEQATTN
jgi:hypothetical protein